MNNTRMDVLGKGGQSDMKTVDLHFQKLCKYYSKYLDTTVCSEEEDRVIVSYNNLRGQYDIENGTMYDLIKLRINNDLYYSVNEKLQSSLHDIENLKESFRVNLDIVREVILYISIPPSQNTKARKLTVKDYELHKRYILKMNPSITADNSCFEYTLECIEKGLYFAILIDDEIVSSTYSPGLLFDEKMIVEIGIDTLDLHRRNGYAYDCSIAMINDLLASGRTPMIVIKHDNYKSINLAKKIGFKIFGEIEKIRTVLE